MEYDLTDISKGGTVADIVALAYLEEHNDDSIEIEKVLNMGYKPNDKHTFVEIIQEKRYNLLGINA